MVPGEKLDPAKEIEKLSREGISFIGLFKNGKVEGPVWYGLVGEPYVGQGFLYGKLNKKGKLTANDISYIYPDYLTSMTGTFEDTLMKNARESKVTQVTCKSGLLRLKFTKRSNNSVIYFYDPPTNETLGSMPLVRDPYEEKTIELQESSIPGAGHGLFAIRNIPKGQVKSI